MLDKFGNHIVGFPTRWLIYDFYYSKFDRDQNFIFVHRTNGLNDRIR